MKPLPIEFTRWGDQFRLIKRNEIVAMYERITPQGSRQIEVWLIIRQQPRTVFGRQYPAEELSPPTRLWGSRGWTFLGTGRGRSNAEEKYLTLSTRRPRKQESCSTPTPVSEPPKSADVEAGVACPASQPDQSISAIKRHQEKAQLEFSFSEPGE